MKLPELYPLKFEPYLKRVLWGGHKIASFKGLDCSDRIGESWEISGLEGKETHVTNGPLKGLTVGELIERYGERFVGDYSIEKYGKEFPLLIKFIHSEDDLSIQVHPDGATAKRLAQSSGKNEMSYVIEAEKGAKFYSGLKKEFDSKGYREAIENKSILDYIACHESHVGDVYYVPAGRIHSIGAGHFIAEIQQASDVTYRIFDYDRLDCDGKKRELHISEAEQSIDFNVHDNYVTIYDKTEKHTVFNECDTFMVERHIAEASDPELVLEAHNSFMILIIVNGQFSVRYGNSQKISAAQGETVLIPACLGQIGIKGEGLFLTTTLI